MRDGSLLHALQAAARPPDPDPTNSSQHVLQAQELQNGSVLRPTPSRTRPQARGRAASEKDPTSVREVPHR